MKRLRSGKLLSLGVVFLISASLPGVAVAGSATWSAAPTSGDWNTAANWSPNTVPNGPSDVATFGQSSNRNVSISQITDVDSINILAYDSYVISAYPGFLNLDGAGVINDEGGLVYFDVVQNFSGGGIAFHNSAKAGADAFYLIDGEGSTMYFEDSSSADESIIQLLQSQVYFLDNSTAGNALIQGGGIEFWDNSSAGNAVIDQVGGTVDFDYNSTAANVNITATGYSFIIFGSTATAAQGHFTMDGGISAESMVGEIDLGISGGTAIFVVNGGSAPSALGAGLNLLNGSNAENATITANGGTNGGEGATIFIGKGGSGGQASITLNGNSSLTLAEEANATTGSLAGDGQVFLGQNSLKVGSNSGSTNFSGVIQESAKGSGGITKIGTGIWTLTGANTYVGSTTLMAGGLTINNKNGSGTGTGAVQVNGGTLAGLGIIAGATTLGTGSGAGAVLAPGAGATRPVTLTMQSSLTFQSDATLKVRLNTNKAKADAVAANGVLIASGAQFSLATIGGKKLSAGTVFIVIDNTSANPIAGTFANLPEGGTVQAGPNTLAATYSGGAGNDLTLTVQ